MTFERKYRDPVTGTTDGAPHTRDEQSAAPG